MSTKLSLSSDTGSFTCNINPESIKLSRKIEHDVKDKGHTAGKITKHKTYSPDTLSFEIVLDGTGANPEGADSVNSDLQSINSCLYKFNGGSHESPFINVTYGSLAIPSHDWRTTSLDVNYTLFDSSGLPLRAKVSVSLQEHIAPQTLTTRSKMNSPDLTHMRTVREGDSLMNFCRDIYGRIDYYMMVAEHNGLANFRELEIGETLEFPPLAR